MLALLPTLHLSSAAPLTLEGSTLRLAGAGGSVLLEGMDRSLRRNATIRCAPKRARCADTLKDHSLQVLSCASRPDTSPESERLY